MYYPARLKAGIPFHLQAGGRVILVDTTGEAESIDITPMRGGQELRKLPKRQKAFKCQVEFDSIVVVAPVDCLIGLFLSMSDVSLGFADGMMLKVTGEVVVLNGADKPIPVSLQGTTVTVTADNVGINNGNDKPIPVQKQSLATIVDLAPVTVAAANARQSLVSDPTLKRLRVRNASDSQVVAIGGANVTIDNGTVTLWPGEGWSEDDAAGAAWFVVSDAAGAKVQIQGVK